MSNFKEDVKKTFAFFDYETFCEIIIQNLLGHPVEAFLSSFEFISLKVNFFLFQETEEKKLKLEFG